MLACLATVQLLNFAILLVVGLPVPQLYSIDQVATALRNGYDPAGKLSVIKAPAYPSSTMPRDQGPRVALARRLGISPNRVEVFRYIPMGSNVPSDLLDGKPERAVRADIGLEVFLGDFRAAARMEDGHWVTVMPVASEVGHWGWRALLILLTAMIGMAPFAWWLSRRLAGPIALFAAAAEQLGRSFRVAPLDTRGPPEIAMAAEAFNAMQARLQRFVDDRGLLIAAIAHDMRTPLMRLSLRLAQAPGALREAAERDIAEMSTMIVAATEFIRDVREPAKRRALDLRSLTESVTEDLADRGQAVTLIAGDPVIIEAEVSSLKALIANLVDNALKYGGDAEVSLHDCKDEVIIEVRDHGTGVADKDLDHVFEPFFRGEPSRNRDTGGIGLGLASVRAVARAHGGDASLANHPKGGAIARVTLPR